ncbi:hypothetical protein [Streptomyces sp. RTd22]|uniref:hypothetical protein n=1 Tax=Streptomyces sp. RTd22 TaxID=1841249 RepID=UPI00131EC662|nr:hypothetical protein [Streptomyces sp. RTd22]
MRGAVVGGTGVLGYAELWARTGGCGAAGEAAARCTGRAAGDADNGACGDAAPGARPSVGRPNGTDGVGVTARCTGRAAGDADDGSAG